MGPRPNVLVVDDEPLFRDLLSETLTRMNLDVETAEDGAKAIEKINAGEYDLIISDIRMPGITGLDVLRESKTKSPHTEVVMITAFGTIENAVEAMKIGACDYIIKEPNIDHIELVVKKALEHRRLKSENRHLRAEVDGMYGLDNIVGKSVKMKSIFETVMSVADSDATVFIQGPSGTGKELIAKAIHYNSSRRDKPFIKTNCAALPEGIMESELFGHEKGAFTGAIKTRKGRFEAANGGTILLDEVSEMSPALQAKLLRVLQEREFEKVGDVQTIKVDVRIIATTNRIIKEAISEGTFREDLYYRLNVIPLHVPPLRERKKDIPLLIDHFIEKYNIEHSRSIEGLSEESEQLLMRLDWPGNVRELENRIERAVVISQEKQLQTRHFLFEEEEFDYSAAGSVSDTNQTLGEIERQHILHTLRECENNRTRASEILNISVRTLRNKLNEYKERGDLDPYFIKSHGDQQEQQEEN